MRRMLGDILWAIGGWCLRASSRLTPPWDR